MGALCTHTTFQIVHVSEAVQLQVLFLYTKFTRHIRWVLYMCTKHFRWCMWRGGGLGSRPIFKKFHENYAPS